MLEGIRDSKAADKNKEEPETGITSTLLTTRKDGQNQRRMSVKTMHAKLNR
jgi:hypothetical protein